MKRRKKLLWALVLIAILALGALLVMLLWNALLPAIFGIATLNYWQAAGILILSKILFGRFHPHPHGHHKHKSNQMGPEFARMHHKMRDMNREERIEFIRKHWDQEHGSKQAPE